RPRPVPLPDRPVARDPARGLIQSRLKPPRLRAVNPKAMPTPPAALPGLELPPPMALSLWLATIALAIYAVRVLGRRQRRHERRRVGGLSRQFLRYVAGQLPATDLRRLVAETTEGDFWTAIERLSLRWKN